MNDQDVTVTINFEDPVLASGYRSWVGVMAAFHDFTFENLQEQFIETPRSAWNAFVQDEAREAVG
jgi:hypothetical protein